MNNQVEPTKPQSKLRRVSAWLGRVPVVGRIWRRIQEKEFLRNGFNITSIYSGVSAIDQIWVNQQMSLPEMVRARILATVLNFVGVGDAMVVGHCKWLKLCGVTPESSGLKRIAVELPFMTAIEATWFGGTYLLGGISHDNYLRSVGISTVIGIAVQGGVLRTNAILNDYATNDPKYRQSISKRLSNAFGCEKLSAKTKKKLYWGSVTALNGFMLANWVWGERLRQIVLGH